MRVASVCDGDRRRNYRGIQFSMEKDARSMGDAQINKIIEFDKESISKRTGFSIREFFGKREARGAVGRGVVFSMGTPSRTPASLVCDGDRRREPRAPQILMAKAVCDGDRRRECGSRQYAMAIAVETIALTSFRWRKKI